MPRTASEISQAIQTQLKVIIPDLSVDPNTPERKIIDTVSEVIAESDIDSYVLQYQYDVDTKVGTDLDKFVALFGFARQAGRRATGSVTFSRITAAERDIFIGAGAQIIKPATSVSPQISFFTTASVIIPLGGISTEAPIEAADIGPLGNVAANTITQLSFGANTDVSMVFNENGTSGGTNQETDAELRVRFKNTIFRNIAGTRDQFLALAIASRFANKANVIGPISRFVEYVQIEPDLTIVSEIPYSKYTYDFDYYLTNGENANEVFYAPNNVDYHFTDSVPAAFTVDDTAVLPVDSVVLFEHSYCSANSRNDPANNILNYVDVYVSGQDPTAALDSVRFPDSGMDLVNTPGSPYDIQRFRRAETGGAPVVANRFQELIWQPISGLPSSITINGVDYYENTHYWHLKDISEYKGSRRSRDGIEWSSTVVSSVTPGTEFLIDYIFDKLPLTLNELMEKYKQVTTDVLVHSATERYFNINLIVMYSPGFNRAAVDEAMSAALIAFMERQQFGVVLQISDFLDEAHNVPGVDNVRLATPADGVAYGVQEIAGDGVTPIGIPYTNDFALQDSDLPVLNSVVTTQRSQNTW